MAGAHNIPVWRRMGATPCSRSGESAPVVVVGGGPVGLTAALDLGRRGHRVIVLNRLDFIAAGSKAICFSKRSLEIFDRLGVAEALRAQGVTWNIGKVFWADLPKPIYQFDLLPVKDQKQPAFINIQQYHVEAHLVASLSRMDNVELRWGHAVTGVDSQASGVSLKVCAGDGDYELRADYVIACDGSRSTMRDLLGLEFKGDSFEDNFLIADIKMQEQRPAERWFWFDPPFNPGQSALLHKQPDDVWRLDFQLGAGIDRDAAVDPKNVARYVRGMLGKGVDFEPVWYSVYTFRCCRMSSFVHGRVVFAGDSAHLVSPFGARGCNGGISDAYNLGWKLDRILKRESDGSLLDSYDQECVAGADENIRQATRATRFMSVKDDHRTLRDAVLELSADYEFARPFVNSGRLSTAIDYEDSALNTADTDAWQGGPKPGGVAVDAPLNGGWLSEQLGDRWVLLTNGWRDQSPAGVVPLDVGSFSSASLLKERYNLSPGCAYLVRPDQHIAGRWKTPSVDRIHQALARATGGR